MRTLTLHQLARILAARWHWIALATIIALAAAIAALLVLPKRYAATASVVVNARGNDPLALGPNASQATNGVSMSTQVDIIKRLRVARRVVADLGLDRDEKLKADWQAAATSSGFDDWLARITAAGVATIASNDSSIIDIQYTSRDPAHAARFANAYAAAYIETTLELRTDPARQYVAFFDKRLGELRGQVEQAQGRLSAFEQDSGIVNAGGKADVENARLLELSTQLALAQAQAADSSSRQRGTLGAADSSAEAMQNAVVQSLKTQLAAQQVKVQEMSQRLGPNHPEFKRAQAELNELRKRLDGEVGQVASALRTSERVGQARVAEIRSALDAQRQRVLSLQQKRDQASVLQKEVENAQRAYDLVMQRQTQTTLESQAKQTDIALLDRATTPLLPSWPNVPLTLGVAAMLGLMVGCLIALARELVHPMLRSTEDLLASTGLPVLAILPTARLARGSRMRLGAPDRRALPA